jgi:hypothetical protein
LIALFIGGSIVVACSDDTPSPTSEDAGPSCGDGKINGDEKCDTAAKTQPTCSSATMGSKPSGTVTCDKGCVINVSNCKAAGGAGGGGGMGGGTGGIVGMGGGPSTGGKGGTTGKGDAGPDAMPDTGTTPTTEAGKPDAGSGGAGGAGGAPVDSGKG